MISGVSNSVSSNVGGSWRIRWPSGSGVPSTMNAAVAARPGDTSTSGAIVATWATTASSNDVTTVLSSRSLLGEFGDEHVGGSDSQLAGALDLDVQRNIGEGADDVGQRRDGEVVGRETLGRGRTSPVRMPR